MMRSIHDMIAARNAPISPDGDPQGWCLADLDRAECRFPIGERNGSAMFCGAAVEHWAPGFSLGCYCAHHRAYLRGIPNVMEEEAA